MPRGGRSFFRPKSSENLYTFRRIREDFSALKGKTGLREYPTKEAIKEAKGKSH
jgi:hypothetical protein